MNLQKLPPIIAFNAVIAAADVVLLSPGLLAFTGILRLVIVAASIILFIAGNYILLSSAFKKPVLKGKSNVDANDFEAAFKGWKGMNTPFGRQIDAALKQIEQLQSRKSKLRVLSEDNTFDAAVYEVENNMFQNFNRIINRLLIYDKADINDVNRSAAYINKALETNAKYLEVFRKFIDEISMLGDTADSDAGALSLQVITDSLREIRTNGDKGSLDSDFD